MCTCGIPLGAGIIPFSWNLPNRLLSLVSVLSPSNTCVDLVSLNSFKILLGAPRSQNCVLKILSRVGKDDKF